MRDAEKIKKDMNALWLEIWSKQPPTSWYLILCPFCGEPLNQRVVMNADFHDLICPCGYALDGERYLLRAFLAKVKRYLKFWEGKP